MIRPPENRYQGPPTLIAKRYIADAINASKKSEDQPQYRADVHNSNLMLVEHYLTRDMIPADCEARARQTIAHLTARLYEPQP